MGNFLKKIYSVFLMQNSWWLDDLIATPSRPMLVGLFLFIGYIAIIELLDLVTTATTTGIVLSLTLLLTSITGILWLREDKFPFYMIGIFRINYQYQKFQAKFWVVLWGGLGLLILLSILVGW